MKKQKHPQIKFKVSPARGYFSNDGWVNRYNTTYLRKNSAIRGGATVLAAAERVYLKVCCGRKLYNDGIYKNEKGFKEALSIFTEKSLIDYVLN